jgi:hypothetical protein
LREATLFLLVVDIPLLRAGTLRPLSEGPKPFRTPTNEVLTGLFSIYDRYITENAACKSTRFDCFNHFQDRARRAHPVRASDRLARSSQQLAASYQANFGPDGWQLLIQVGSCSEPVDRHGLRNLTGRVNRDGTVTIWAITSTVSGNGDQGADPNKLVMIKDKLAATALPAGESFTTLRTASFAEVLRGVSFTPGTGVPPHREDDDEH